MGDIDRSHLWTRRVYNSSFSFFKYTIFSAMKSEFCTNFTYKLMLLAYSETNIFQAGNAHIQLYYTAVVFF